MMNDDDKYIDINVETENLTNRIYNSIRCRRFDNRFMSQKIKLRNIAFQV